MLLVAAIAAPFAPRDIRACSHGNATACATVAAEAWTAHAHMVVAHGTPVRTFRAQQAEAYVTAACDAGDPAACAVGGHLWTACELGDDRSCDAIVASGSLGAVLHACSLGHAPSCDEATSRGLPAHLASPERIHVGPPGAAWTNRTADRWTRLANGGAVFSRHPRAAPRSRYARDFSGWGPPGKWIVIDEHETREVDIQLEGWRFCNDIGVDDGTVWAIVTDGSCYPRDDEPSRVSIAHVDLFARTVRRLDETWTEPINLFDARSDRVVFMVDGSHREVTWTTGEPQVEELPMHAGVHLLSEGARWESLWGRTTLRRADGTTMTIPDQLGYRDHGSDLVVTWTADTLHLRDERGEPVFSLALTSPVTAAQYVGRHGVLHIQTSTATHAIEVHPKTQLDFGAVDPPPEPVVLPFRSGLIDGTVVRDGQPLADVQVHITPGYPEMDLSPREARTGDDGIFRFDELPLTSWTAVLKKGDDTAVYSLGVEPWGQSGPFELPPALPVGGTVRRNGTPVAGARVALSMAPWSDETTTDAEGRFLVHHASIRGSVDMPEARLEVHPIDSAPWISRVVHTPPYGHDKPRYQRSLPLWLNGDDPVELDIELTKEPVLPYELALEAQPPVVHFVTPEAVRVWPSPNHQRFPRRIHAVDASEQSIYGWWGGRLHHAPVPDIPDNPAANAEPSWEEVPHHCLTLRHNGRLLAGVPAELRIGGPTVDAPLHATSDLDGALCVPRGMDASLTLLPAGLDDLELRDVPGSVRVRVEGKALPAANRSAPHTGLLEGRWTSPGADPVVLTPSHLGDKGIHQRAFAGRVWISDTAGLFLGWATPVGDHLLWEPVAGEAILFREAP